MQTPAWFDKAESALFQISRAVASSQSPLSPHSASVLSPDVQNSEVQLQAGSLLDDDDDEDDGGDQERLDAVKGLIFDTYKIQNREGMDLEGFIDDLHAVFDRDRQGLPGHATLYQSLFKVPL